MWRARRKSRAPVSPVLAPAVLAFREAMGAFTMKLGLLGLMTAAAALIGSCELQLWPSEADLPREDESKQFYDRLPPADPQE